MPKIAKNLTDAFVKTVKCPPGVSRVEFADGACKGLLLRVTPKQKSWNFKYRPPGATARTPLLLGTYPEFSLEEAHGLVVAARKLVQQGLDPREEAAKAAVAKASVRASADPELPVNWTIRKLLGVWYIKKLNPPHASRAAASAETDSKVVALAPKGGRLKRRAKKRATEVLPLRGADEIMRIMNHDVLPVIGDMLVRDFAVAHLNRVIGPIEDRGCFVLANRAFVYVKQLLRFGVQSGCILFSPIAELTPPYEEGVGTRFLSLDEIKHLWGSMATAFPYARNVQLLIKLWLATGKRNSELLGARQSEIDLKNRMWTIPAGRIKARNSKAKDEKVPLSDLAIWLFRQAMQGNDTDWVFPNLSGKDHYNVSLVGDVIRQAQEPAEGLPLGRLGMEPWTPHDLRRTVGTQLLTKANGLGLTEKQKYLVLNHTIKKDVSQRVYDGNDYIEEKEDALNKWGKFLSELVGAPTGLRQVA